MTRSSWWLPYALFVAGCALVVRFTYDDSYIYLRVLHGPHLAGNGVASYLWALLGAFGPWGLKVASFLSGIVLLRCVQAEAGTEAACVVACFPGAWLHGVSGMETMAAAALLAAVYRFRFEPFIASILAFLAGAVRIEVGCAALLMVALYGWREALQAGVLLGVYALLIRVGIGPYAPAIAKLSQHHPGVGSVAKACATLAVVFAAPALLHRMRWAWLIRQREWIAVAAFLVVIAIPRHLGGYGHRLVWPVVPLVVMLLAPTLWRSRVVAACALASAIVLSIPTVTYAWWYARGIEAHHAVAWQMRTLGVGRIAATDVGVLAYESGAETLDLLGLTSTGHAATPEDVIAFEPDRVVLIAKSWSGWEPQWLVPYEAPIAAALRQRGWHYNDAREFCPGYILVELAPRGQP